MLINEISSSTRIYENTCRDALDGTDERDQLMPAWALCICTAIHRS